MKVIKSAVGVADRSPGHLSTAIHGLICGRFLFGNGLPSVDFRCCLCNFVRFSRATVPAGAPGSLCRFLKARGTRGKNAADKRLWISIMCEAFAPGGSRAFRPGAFEG